MIEELFVINSKYFVSIRNNGMCSKCKRIDIVQAYWKSRQIHDNTVENISVAPTTYNKWNQEFAKNNGQ